MPTRESRVNRLSSPSGVQPEKETVRRLNHILDDLRLRILAKIASRDIGEINVCVSVYNGAITRATHQNISIDKLDSKEGSK